MVKMKKDSNLSSALEIWTDALNQIADIFNKEKKKRYPEGILLISAITEEFLRFLIAYRFVFSRQYPNLSKKNQKDISDYCDKLSFYNKVKLALLLGLIDNATYKNLESFRTQRNLYIHSFLFVPKDADVKSAFELFNKILPELIKKIDYYLDKADE